MYTGINTFIYLIIYLVVIFLSFLYYKTKIKGYYYLAYIVLTIFSALRFDVGPDYYTYVNGFYYATPTDLSFFDDYFIFKKLSLFFADVDRGYIIVFAIYAILINALIFRFVNRMKIPCLGLFVFLFLGFYFDSLDRIRQFLAIAIFLNSIELLEKKKYLKFLIIISFIAAVVHNSAFMLIAIIPILQVNISKRFYVGSIVSILMLSLLGVTKSLWLFIFNITPYASIYSNTGYVETGSFSSSLGFLFVVGISTIAIVYSQVPRMYKNLLFCGVLIYIIASGNLIISRFSAYFMVLNIYLLPSAMNSVALRQLKMSLIVLLFVFFAKDVNRNYFTYKSIFSIEFLMERFEERDIGNLK